MDGVPDDAICYLHPVGLGGYNKHPNAKDKKWWEYTKEELKELGDAADAILKGNAVLPVAMDGNLYLNHAVPSSHDQEAKVYKQSGLKVETDSLNGKVSIHLTDPELVRGASKVVVDTDLLGKTYHAEMKYEQPDSSPYRLDSDFYGSKRTNSSVTPGPFEFTEDGLTTFEI